MKPMKDTPRIKDVLFMELIPVEEGPSPEKKKDKKEDKKND